MKWSYHGREWGNFTPWKLDFARCCVDVLEYRHIKSLFLFHSHSVPSLTNADKNLQWTANWTATRLFEDLTAKFVNVMISFSPTVAQESPSLSPRFWTLVTQLSFAQARLWYFIVRITSALDHFKLIGKLSDAQLFPTSISLVLGFFTNIVDVLFLQRKTWIQQEFLHNKDKMQGCTKCPNCVLSLK